MKKVGNLYNKITDIKNIKIMYDKRVRLNTKNKIKDKDVLNIIDNIIDSTDQEYINV